VALLRRGGDLPAIRTPGQHPHGSVLLGHDGAFLARRVPEANGAVLQSSGNPPAVRTPGQDADCRSLAAGDGDLLVCRQLAEVKSARPLAVVGQPFAVWAHPPSRTSGFRHGQDDLGRIELAVKVMPLPVAVLLRGDGEGAP